MLNASLLAIIEEASIAVLTLTEGLEKEEFLNSRLTRAEVVRQVRIMTAIAAKLPGPARSWPKWIGPAGQPRPGN